MAAVMALHDNQPVPFATVAMEHLDPAHHIPERSPATTIQAVTVMQFFGPVDTDTDEKTLVM